VRWILKGAFLAYFIFTCVQLFRFAAWARGNGPYVPRPEAPAGLLPLGHFLSFFAWIRGGGWDSILPAGLVIIIGALATSLLFKRGFCGWICPVGTVWEGSASLGRRVLRERVLRVPKAVDTVGRAFRYLLTGAALLLLVVAVPLDQAVAFRTIPYMKIADIKTIGGMLTPGYLALLFLAAVLSAAFGRPVWCRYLCPVGGLYSVLGVLSPSAVRRDEKACLHCGRCNEVCHAHVDVERTGIVRDTECDGCMECVRACPAEECLTPKVASRLPVRPWVWPLLVVLVWFAVLGVAKFTGNWDSPVTPAQFKAVIVSGALERPSAPDVQDGPVQPVP
jgi:polyferredoxin